MPRYMLEAIVVVARDALTHGIHDPDAALPRLVPPEAAELRRPDVGMAEESVDAARLPVARISRIDEDHGVEIARQPDARGEPGRTTADDRDVEDVRSANRTLVRRFLIPRRHSLSSWAGAGSTLPQARKVPATCRGQRPSA